MQEAGGASGEVVPGKEEGEEDACPVLVIVVGVVVVARVAVVDEG